MMSERIRAVELAELPPGHMICIVIDGLPIALANVAGTIYAFGDSCRHEGGSLASGALIEHTVTCPWHGWTYDVRSGKSIVPPVGLRVPTYPVHIEAGTIFVEVIWS